MIQISTVILFSGLIRHLNIPKQQLTTWWKISTFNECPDWGTMISAQHSGIGISTSIAVSGTCAVWFITSLPYSRFCMVSLAEYNYTAGQIWPSGQRWTPKLTYFPSVCCWISEFLLWRNWGSSPDAVANRGGRWTQPMLMSTAHFVRTVEGLSDCFQVCMHACVHVCVVCVWHLCNKLGRLKKKKKVCVTNMKTRSQQ